MESKRVGRARGVPLKSLLLIEPVWNRNRGQPVRPFGLSELLIEPVWNRNLTITKRFANALTFNRTSMESKREKADF